MSDDEVMQYIRQFCASDGHYMGTAAMARRELGGVVGNDLKVHGTMRCRCQYPSYAVGRAYPSHRVRYWGKAADLIKSEQSWSS
ncbi:hypothetical protein B0H19DRAFT_1254052 [Mycena capillaripes]|nr:hypothetical protein B0H19DRAFT_1254052 [Mycena capillaripes]